MSILVTGGCGYIGAHTIIDLIENGYDVVNIDSQDRSTDRHIKALQEYTGKTVSNYKVNLCDKEAVRKVFEKHPDINGIIHFAAFKSVGESVEQPLAYYRNNLFSQINLLELTEEFNIKNFVFSSSCSVYGNTTELPVTEQTPRQEAESPYGNSKRVGEDIIKDTAKVSKNNFVSLRYFNPIGAHHSGCIGEVPYGPPQNLQPIIMETALGKRELLKVFGSDYKTRDGSCIRDYIHVMDLAHAHTLALQYLAEDRNDTNYEIFNIGSGDGVTVFEMIEAFEKTTETKLNYEVDQRRPGDVEAIYADNAKTKDKLGWIPKYNIDDMMLSAWKWNQEAL
ncbi:UNVERIFIED_CONTAM: hypothetical protein GTU68_002035 [Idotea baltica]|nr:hypothetical protein [Idotea baltica]